MDDDIIIGLDDPSDFVRDSVSLTKQAWEEAGYKEQFNIDYAPYYDEVRRNNIVIITARKDGNLIGFITFIGNYCFHSRSMVAIASGVFIDKRYRGGATFRRMLDMAKTLFFAKGYAIRIATPPGNDFSVILRRYGGKLTEKVYDFTREI